MSGWDPLTLYRAAQGTDTAMSGYYNTNVRMDTPTGPVLVRIPIPRADRMDVHIWDESEVLRAVGPRVDRIPRLLHVCCDPPFQIHEFVPGRQLNEFAPRGVAVPPTVITDVLTLFDQLATIPADELPALPAGWPDDGYCADFARLLSTETQQVYDDNQQRFGDLFHAFGIPDDPLATTTAAWSSLTPRPFRLVHADVHRQNMIISPRGTIFLDWELALWGDPVYELAVHIHKMAYLDTELHHLLSGWETRTHPSATRSWHDDLTTYLRHERVKSAIVDSIRYTKEIITEETPERKRKILLDKLAGKLNTARKTWGQPADLNVSKVVGIINNWNVNGSYPPVQGTD